jgi:N-acetylglucosamine kinase-like BadF-type ATPase
MKRDPLVHLPRALSEPTPQPDARFVMGIDGGATKTLAAVLDLRAGALHLGHAGPSNEDAVGARSAVDALLAAADEAIERAGIGAEDLAAAVLAVAGTDTEAVAQHVLDARTERWIVVNDVVGAWATATGAGPGVAVISGTGSNVFGVGGGDGRRPADARAWRAGGWGHLLGDEGSGYWLGVQSIKAALRDREASGPETALSEAVCKFFGTTSVEAVASRVYAKPLTKGEIAAFAKETARVAQDGDAVARELFERGARELADQIAAVIRQTGLGGETSGRGAPSTAAPGARAGEAASGAGEAASGAGEAASGDGFPVGLIGSAFKAGAVFVDPLARAVRAHAPLARVEIVEMAPVGGSLLLAIRACGGAGGPQPGELSRTIDDALSA